MLFYIPKHSSRKVLQALVLSGKTIISKLPTLTAMGNAEACVSLNIETRRVTRREFYTVTPSDIDQARENTRKLLADCKEAAMYHNAAATRLSPQQNQTIRDSVHTTTSPADFVVLRDRHLLWCGFVGLVTAVSGTVLAVKHMMSKSYIYVESDCCVKVPPTEELVTIYSADLNRITEKLQKQYVLYVERGLLSPTSTFDVGTRVQFMTRGDFVTYHKATVSAFVAEITEDTLGGFFAHETIKWEQQQSPRVSEIVLRVYEGKTGVVSGVLPNGQPRVTWDDGTSNNALPLPDIICAEHYIHTDYLKAI